MEELAQAVTLHPTPISELPLIKALADAELKSRPKVEQDSPKNEVKVSERTEYSEREMSKLTGKSRHILKDHRSNNPPGTPMTATIEGKLCKIMCIESGAARSPSKWVAEPL